MSTNTLKFIIIISVSIFGFIVLAYISLMKKIDKKDIKLAKQLKEGTETNKFSIDVIYMKLYMIYLKIPGLKRYLLKIRRRLEIVNIQDEYQTRKQASSSLTKALIWVIPLTILIIAISSSNTLLMVTLLLFEIFIVESLVEGNVNKLDNKLLKQQIGLFAEIRHAYHESSMVEEAIYQVAQSNEQEVSLQVEKIYEILIADDPETELEKYYDIAPNSYLKEFAGLSYLTKEFGDRKTDSGSSLYLRNLNNITQEMQLEILKRDKLDYVFQSLSVIALVAILLLEPLKTWAISNFTFVESFYSGKLGTVAELIIMILTIICYVMIRKVKDTTKNNVLEMQNEHPWQEKLYKNPIAKIIVNAFMPKKKTKEHMKLTKLLKDSASPLKIEWMYVNKIVMAITTFIVSIFIFLYIHDVATNWVYEEVLMEDGTTSMMMSNTQKRQGEKIREVDNKILDKLRGDNSIKKERIRLELSLTSYYSDADDETLDKATNRVYKKLKTINAESQIQWYEVLMSMGFCSFAYMFPNILLIFQKKMREIEMEDEVMQFQTIILMLMKIERVNVEMILEWIERYSNIFRVPISKCVNNYESGAWEALEELKGDATYPKFVEIVESLQAAVEKIPIKEAFDELETEREYYKEKRKQSNEQLISRKGMVGKIFGFAPMIVLFVGYLIAPLVLLGLMNMGSSMSAMQSMV
ncbi:MAG: hypothetical protein HFJ18_02025 [Clostridia bacterium]|nr:hypothetical protein [Clostridia bacterium]